MEQTKQQDSLDIRKTQIVTENSVGKTSGWFEDGWHLAMVFLGMGVFLVFLLLILWQSGGIDGLAELWLSKTKQNMPIVPTVEPKLIYRNSNSGIGFEYTPSYFIEETKSNETIITVNGQNEEDKVSVVLLPLNAATLSGELNFDCAIYIDGCKKITEKNQVYTTDAGLAGIQSSMKIMTSSGSAELKTFVFDINNSKFSKLLIFPVGGNSNNLAQELVEKMFLIKSEN